MHLPLQVQLRTAGKRRSRGQALVLGALSFLVLALMVTLSFNIAQALRAKMSLQQHSDTLAYSMAVMEARALNYYAVTNRSIAASYVAMNSLHGYMAAASVTGPMMQAGSSNFRKIAAQEFLLCACKTCIKHCLHAKDALKIADKYSDAADEYEDKARSLDGPFRTAVGALDRMVDTLHASQRRTHEQTREAIRDGMSHGLRQLTLLNAPGATGLPENVGGINVNEFDCAVDGMNCSGSVSSSSPKIRAQVMTEIANASRPGWPARRAGVIGGLLEPRFLHPTFRKELTRDIPGSSNAHLPINHKGTAKTVQDDGSLNEGGMEGGNEGPISGAEEEGEMFNWWGHTLPVTSSYDAKVSSSSKGGDHEPGDAHSGTHDFQGVNARAFETCTASGNCFMRFRANPDPRRDWGQPRVYSYVTQRLRIGDPVKKAPWEINRSAEISFTHGAQGEGKLTLAPGEGAGLSKALVYYHRFNDRDWDPNGSSGSQNGWREQPNLFAPYWRAKLHPFTPEQAQQVLEAAGNTDAQALVQNSQGLAL